MPTETKSLAEALAVLMTKLPEIKKSQEAKVKTDKANYSYNYADLAQISRALMPILGDLGLSFTARPTLIDGRFVLAYKLLHSSGESEDGEYPLPASGSPQSVGSAITYARRYCLCAVTGVAPEDDDDGAAAQANYHHQAARPEPQWETPPPEPVTDPDWANHLLQRITDVSSQAVLRGLYEEMDVKYRAGEVATADQRRFVDVIAQRKAELEGKPK
jgi:hypothetical protein